MSELMKRATKIADKLKINYDNVFYLGIPLSKMTEEQLRISLAHSIGLNQAYGAINKKGESVLPKKQAGAQ